MAEKTYLFSGLDVRSNQLEREGNTARDCSNVRLDGNRKLIKREEFAPLGILIPATETILDFYEFNNSFFIITKTDTALAGQLFYNKFYTWTSGGGLVAVTPNTAQSQLHVTYGYISPGMRTFDSKCTFFEEGGSLFFQGHSNSNVGGFAEGKPLLMKYDGQNVCCAGIPQITVEKDSGSGYQVQTDNYIGEKPTLAVNEKYVRFVVLQIDNQGVQRSRWVSTFTDILTTPSTDSKYGMPRYNDAVLNHKFYFPNPFGVSSTDIQEKRKDASNYATANIRLDLSGVVNYNAPQVVPASDIFCTDKTWVMFGGGIGSSLDIPRVYVQSVNIGAGQATIGAREIYARGRWVTETEYLAIYGGLPSATLSGVYSCAIGTMYASTDYTTGFTNTSIALSMPSSGTVAALAPTRTALIQDFDQSPFDRNTQISPFFEVFHPELVRVNPQPSNHAVLYANGISCLTIDDDSLYFSDISLNATIESFNPTENFIVGEKKMGNLKAVFANETFLVAFRERETYLIVGNLFTGNFRVQSYRSTRIGCSAASSLADLAGQCVFMSNRGPSLAMENGSLGEISDSIEPIFTEDVLSLNLNLIPSDTAIDFKRENIYMTGESGNGTASDVIFLYDYKYKEWFKYGDISARGGILVGANEKLYYSDGEDIYEEQTGYTTGVSAFWASNFETLERASLKKRFQRLHIFLTSLVTGVLGIKAYKDWNSTTPYTDVSITPNPVIPMDNVRMNPKLAYSNSFDISSTGTNIMQLDGFEYAYEIEQEELNDDVR